MRECTCIDSRKGFALAARQLLVVDTLGQLAVCEVAFRAWTILFADVEHCDRIEIYSLCF